MVNAALFEATDCACSALVCNCFQLACCLPTAADEAHHSIVRVDNANWMERLGAVSPNIKFRDLILIGAHDSGSFSFPNTQPYSAVSKRQNIDMTQQLTAGVRILDLRVAISKRARSKIAIWHGCVQGGDFVDTVLHPVKAFVERHPQEVVVLQLVPEHTRPFPSDERKRALHLINEILGSKIMNGGHMSELLQSWTLGDLRNRPNARVVVLVHNRFYSKITKDSRLTEKSILEEYGFAPMDKWLRCLWFNTRDKETLMEYALEDVTRYGRQKRQFHASQLVLTPGVGSFADAVAALMGINSLRPASLAFRMYGDLGRYFRQHSNQGWNWVLLDFVDLGPWILHFLTALNFPISLKLHLAVFQSQQSRNVGKPGMNVTAQIQGCVCRSRVLYVDNFRQVLGLSPDALGTLTLVYTLDKVTQTALLHVGSSNHGQSVLISGSGHLCPEDSITILPSNRSQGYIHNGSVLSENANVVGLKGTVLEFANVDGVFSCQIYMPRNKSRGLTRQPVRAPIAPRATVRSRPKLLVLVSKTSFDRTAIQNQQNAMTVLDAKGIEYATLDGADPANKEERNKLFVVSNLRAKYPQFFLVNGNGNETFWGDFETFQNANESGSLVAELGGGGALAAREISSSQEAVMAAPNTKPRVLVLVSRQSFNRGVVQNQQKTLSVLEAKGIPHTTLDGADVANKAARNELFKLSDRRGEYPQIFLIHRRTGEKIFWGGFDAFEQANDNGTLEHEMTPV